MTLIAWAGHLEDLAKGRNNIERLQSFSVGVVFDKQLEYLRPWTYVYLVSSQGVHGIWLVEFYFASPAYSPLIHHYVGLGEMRLDHKTRRTGEYTPVILRSGSYSLLRDSGWLYIVIELTESKQLHILEIAHPYKSMTIPRLFPQFLL